MEQHVQYLTTPEGARIAYAVVGSGPPLVWISGWLSHLEIEWASKVRRPSLELLATGVTLIRHDKRGTGLSSRHIGDYSIESAVRDLEALVEHLRLERFAIGGLSEGGSIATSYAARHPERVTKLVVCGAYADGSGLFAPAEMREAIRAVVKTQWGLGSKLLAAMFLGDDANVAAERFGRFQLASATSADALAVLDRAININILDVLASITAPALVYHHRDDMVVPIALGQELAQNIKGARFLSGPGGHIPSARGWINFTRAALSFLRGEELPEAELRGERRGIPGDPTPVGLAAAPLYDDGALMIDADRHVVMRNGARVALAPTEFRLLIELAAAPGRVRAYADLLHRVWGAEYVGDTGFLHVYISRLRKKLGQRVILTERGFGYRFGAVSDNTTERPLG